MRQPRAWHRYNQHKNTVYAGGHLVAIENAPTGTLTASPNPISVTDGSGLGVTTLSYSATGTSNTQIWSNNNTLVCSGGASGSCTTGKWVTDGMTFQLKDANSGRTIKRL